MVQRPKLFGAVLFSVPMLDMQRYHKQLAQEYAFMWSTLSGK